MFQIYTPEQAGALTSLPAREVMRLCRTGNVHGARKCGRYWRLAEWAIPYLTDPSLREKLHLARIRELLTWSPERMGNIPHPHAPGVYVVHALRGGLRVKVGRAVNIAKRSSSLQSGNPQPLRLIAILSDDPGKERVFHERFAEHRVAGEWFNAVGSVRDAILRARRERQ